MKKTIITRWKWDCQTQHNRVHIFTGHVVWQLLNVVYHKFFDTLFKFSTSHNYMAISSLLYIHYTHVLPAWYWVTKHVESSSGVQFHPDFFQEASTLTVMYNYAYHYLSFYFTSKHKFLQFLSLQITQSAVHWPNCYHGNLLIKTVIFSCCILA